MTSPSICQLSDLSVSQAKHDSTWQSVHLSVCPSSVLSVQPSAKNHKYSWMKFPKVQILGNFLYVHTSLDSSVNPSGSLSVTPSLSAENLLKFPGNYREKNAVNYLHEIPVNIPTIHTSSVVSVITLISASYVPSIHPLDDEGWEILEQFPSTNYEENFLVVITAKILMT